MKINPNLFQYESYDIKSLIEQIDLTSIDIEGAKELLENIKFPLEKIMNDPMYRYAICGEGVEYRLSTEKPNEERRKQAENFIKLARGIENTLKFAYAYVLIGLGEEVK